MHAPRFIDIAHLPSPLLINHQSFLNSHRQPRSYVWVVVSLVRRGGCGINTKSRSLRSAADGVVAHTQTFQNAFRNVTRERPPSPRLFGTGPFFDGAATPPLQGGEYVRLNSFTASMPLPRRAWHQSFSYGPQGWTKEHWPVTRRRSTIRLTLAATL